MVISNAEILMWKCAGSSVDITSRRHGHIQCGNTHVEMCGQLGRHHISTAWSYPMRKYSCGNVRAARSTSHLDGMVISNAEILMWKCAGSPVDITSRRHGHIQCGNTHTEMCGQPGRHHISTAWSYPMRKYSYGNVRAARSASHLDGMVISNAEILI